MAWAQVLTDLKLYLTFLDFQVRFYILLLFFFFLHYLSLKFTAVLCRIINDVYIKVVIPPQDPNE